ncbi:unnamed protein product [Ophioblennius macclurei]
MEDTTWLEERLRCPVCHDILSDPRQLPCGHSMCVDCVKKLLDHSSSSEAPLRCPDCRAEVGPAAGLRRSYTLSSIAEDFRLNKKTTENQRRTVYCDYCPGGTTLASRTCLKCEVSLCKEHVKHHLELPVLAGHPLVSPLGDLTERKCHQHEDEVLRYYCSSSRRYICNICALEIKQLNAATEASSVLRRQLTEYMEQHFETLRKQVTDFTASIRRLQDDIQHDKMRMNTGHPHLNGVTVVLLFLWFIVSYYAYNFSVENQTLTEALKNQQNHRSQMCSPTREHLLNQQHDFSSQCFSSGTHVWEVEAEGHWDISVFYRSSQRKSFGNDAETWSLKHNGEGSLSACHNKTKTVLAATLKSNRIAVRVNFEEGSIVFSSVDLTTTQLHEFKAELTQPVCLNVEVHLGDSHSRASIVKVA